MKNKIDFEVIIIGGSYSGLAAGMALGRALRNVLIIDSGKPCNRQTPHSHNFLTQDGRTPQEISATARQQVKLYNTVKIFDGFATSSKKTDNGFAIKVASGEVFTARKLVFATGIKDIMPDIPGFATCWGISVLHCPYCHGYEVRHQTTGIIANGETGFELSSLISKWTNDLTLYTNGRSTLTDQQKAKLGRHKIKISEKPIREFEHKNGFIENLVFKDGTKAAVRAVYSRLPFEQHSAIPRLLGCDFTEEGYIKIDPSHKTTAKSVFACGDNTTRMRTVANAVAMGTTTGIMLNKELLEEEF